MGGGGGGGGGGHRSKLVDVITPTRFGLTERNDPKNFPGEMIRALGKNGGRTSMVGKYLQLPGSAMSSRQNIGVPAAWD